MEGKLSEDEYNKKISSDIKPIRTSVDQSDFEVPEEPEPEEGQEDLEGEEEKEEQPQTQTKAKVPQYRAETAVKEPRPGGPAFQYKKPSMPKPMVKEPVSARSLIKGAPTAAKELSKKAAQAMAKLAVRAVAATAQYWLPILLAIILIVGIIFAIIMFVRAISGAEGTTPVQASDVINDHVLIKSVLAMSNQADFEKMLNDNKQALITDLSDFIKKIQDKYPSDARTTPSVKQLEQVIALIGAYTTPDAAKAQTIKDLIVAAVKPWKITLKPGSMIYPSGNVYTTITNRYRVGHAGIDSMMPIGTPLYASTNGKIVHLIDTYANLPAGKNNYRNYDQNGGFGNIIIVEMDSPIGEAKFWEAHHLSPGTVSKKVGDHVEQGELIALSGHNGSSSAPHLHFEVDKVFCNMSCNTKGGFDKTVNPKIPLGWK